MGGNTLHKLARVIVIYVFCTVYTNRRMVYFQKTAITRLRHVGPSLKLLPAVATASNLGTFYEYLLNVFYYNYQRT